MRMGVLWRFRGVFLQPDYGVTIAAGPCLIFSCCWRKAENAGVSGAEPLVRTVRLHRESNPLRDIRLEPGAKRTYESTDGAEVRLDIATARMSRSDSQLLQFGMPGG